MMYSEFLKGTGAPENSKTWELGRLRKGEFTVRHEIGLEEK